jgi:sterol desaturase/sphingolipid hydroxylase (fatty acid hydroxylase superfamily)
MPDWLTPLTATVALGILWAAEGLAPLFERRHRLSHGLRNAALGLINGGVRVFLLAPLLLLVAAACEWGGIGLMRRTGFLELHALASLLAAVLILDFWGYVWHILWHKVPLFWRFHSVHHHDPEVDATTAFRFHAGEVALAGLAMLGVVAAFGLTVEHVLIYELVLVPVSLFHHANIRLPERLDAALRLVIVTPRMHMVHHSRWEPETDSNFGAILSIWDRALGTMRLRADPARIEQGLDGYSRVDTDSLAGLLATPLGPIKSRYGRAPEEARPGPGQAEVPVTAAASSRGRHLPLALAVIRAMPPAGGPPKG